VIEAASSGQAIRAVGGFEVLAFIFFPPLTSILVIRVNRNSTLVALVWLFSRGCILKVLSMLCWFQLFLNSINWASVCNSGGPMVGFVVFPRVTITR